MKNTSETPCMSNFPEDIHLADDSTKKKYFLQTIGKFVDKYVLNYASDASSLLTVCQEQRESDGIHNYACSLLTHGLLERTFKDASQEGDGERLFRHWKFLLLHFKATGHTKYALEAFLLIANVKVLLSPRMAHQLMWNRTCNSHGGAGKNIPLDLHLEHMNRIFKDDINTFRANITEHSINRSGNAVGPLSAFLHKFDIQA